MATTTVNGMTVNLTIEELAQLLNLATKETAKAAKTAKRERAAKVDAKAETRKAKHDAILDTKRVSRMVITALERANAQGFECKTSKQGKWIWLYPTNGKGRTPEFKALKLAKGWKYSPKRGAFYRDFSAC